MGSSCSPQSELAQFFLGFAQGYPVAARCNCDCIMCVAQGIKGHADLASSSPSSPNFKHEKNSCTKFGAVSCDTYNTRRGLRSLPHLREQFKPRTDDGHASPVLMSCEAPCFYGLSLGFLTLVRFFVYHRIKPHNPLLVQVPVYSFEF